MRNSRSAVLLLAIALLVGMVFASSATADRPANPKLVPVQLALGDSWAAGVGATPPEVEGYVPQLYKALLKDYDCPSPGQPKEAADGCPQLELENLAVPGATTKDMIDDQFPEAIQLLELHNGDANPFNDVQPVTLHIGGNDVTDPIIDACLGGLTTACVERIQFEFAEFQTDLNRALGLLEAAAGNAVAIVIGTYDNPIPTCVLATVPGAIQLGALVLEGAPGSPIPEGLNDIIRRVAATYGDDVAEVFGDLAPEDWVGGNDCLHPDNSGYDKVTVAFLEALGPVLGLD
jgi:lysophospholipase L1-like esterase